MGMYQELPGSLHGAQVRSGQPLRSNLPEQPTPLVGRGRELATIQQLLHRPNVRLVTITGPGGVGKTRLALQVAEDLMAEFGDGVWLVPLASISEPDLVVSTIAQVLGLQEAGERPILVSLKAYLEDKQILLLLDNFEHVVVAAPVVAELLATSRQLKVLVTSRAALHLSGEHEFQAPPLELPDPKQLPDMETLLKCEAVALFTQRVGAVLTEFRLNDANAQAIAELSVRLDGLPLALELAAARAKLMPPQMMLEQMVGTGHMSALRLLTGGARDLPARQQTLHNTIEWSYTLLSTVEQRLFWRLAVFAGGCTFQAAEAVCDFDGDLTVDILDGLASLVDNSLLRQADLGNGQPRLAMLETIREFGLERLAESGEVDAVQHAHAAYYQELAEVAAPNLKGAEQQMWFSRLEDEHDNLRAALSWSLEQGEIEIALRMAGALWWFWFVRGHLAEGRRWLDKALAPEVGAPVILRAKVLNGGGVLAHYQGDLGRAGTLCAESLALCRQLEDKAGIAAALNGLALVARSGGNLSAARAMYEESVALLRQVGDRWGIAYTLSYLALVVYYQGDFMLTHSLSGESLELFRGIGDKQGSTTPLTLLGMANVKLGDPKTARSVLEECLAIARSLRDQRSSARALHQLGGVAFAEGDYSTSRTLRQEALAILDELGDRVLISQYIVELAEVVAVQGDCLLAARVFGAGETLRESIGANLLTAYIDAYERAVAAARAGLSQEDFAAAWAEGRTMSPGQVLAALKQPAMPPQDLMVPQTVASSSRSTTGMMGGAEADQSPASSRQQAYPAGLSEREVEVLRLVAQGLSDAQVAERLILSARTINSHLRSIYSKLAVSSRTAAVRYAQDHSLLP